MYVSAERLAIADREVIETFGQTSIAWQAIPHWDTGDPGQTYVRNDVVANPGSLPLLPDRAPFVATLAQLGAPTPDSLLAEVMAVSATLAATVDGKVLDALLADPIIAGSPIVIVAAALPEQIVDSLIDARARVEDAGYRAPSCLITNTEGLKKVNAFSGCGYPVTDSILAVTNINSVHRASHLDKLGPDPKDPKKKVPKAVMLLIGRRQRIAAGAAADASPGEEPLDLAVSVLPSSELVGENLGGDIDMAVRTRYATRIKDPKAVILLAEA